MQLRSILSSIAFGCAAAASLGTVAAIVISCSTSPSYSTASAVSGAPDMHCVLQDGGAGSSSYIYVQPTSQGSCMYRPPVDAPSPPPEAGAPDAPPPPPAFGTTMYDSSGRDDDCKYFVQWESTPADVNGNVYFQAKAQFNAQNPSQPLTGAYPYIEAFLSDTHVAPPTHQTYEEGPAGTYKIGPIKFDQTGMWTVRFHWNGNCFDYSPESPHGHSAFYVEVK